MKTLVILNLDNHIIRQDEEYLGEAKVRLAQGNGIICFVWENIDTLSPSPRHRISDVLRDYIEESVVEHISDAICNMDNNDSLVYNILERQFI